jgi:hypothetical protein
VSGHRDTGKTSCPGDALYDQLDEIRGLVESGTPFATSSAHVTAALADQSVDYGETVPVTGALTGPDGNALAGQAVELQVNSDDAWRTARRVTTGADGAFATDLKPAKRMYVRVLYPGNADVRGSASARLLLHLRPVLRFDRPPKRATRGRRLVVVGTVAPRKRTVSVVFQQRVGARWRRVGSRAVRARHGRFSASFVPTFRARYRYYAVTKSDLDTDRGASELQPLRVH